MSDNISLKSKVAKGLWWGGLNNGTQQLLNLIIGIFLARILTPADYGMVGMLAIFSAVASSLQEGGFISALTNRKNATHLDFSSVFWFSVTLSVLFYLILFFCAPIISEFYKVSELTSLSRFIFLSFVISSINIAPRAFLFKNLRVREITIVTLISLFISGIVGIVLSLKGYSYWALAWQTVTYTSGITFFTFLISKWKPLIRFSFEPIKEMLGYSSKIVITNIFSILNNNIFAVLLGKFYSANDVGDFNQANKWNTMGYSLITGMIYGVAQPVFAKVSEEKERQVKIFRKMLRFTAFVCFPGMFGLSLIAKDFIVIAITEKWLTSAYFLQILCIWGAFYPISYLFSNLILSQGRSKVYMWITIILCLIQIAAVYFSYPYGIVIMLYVFITINILWIGIWYAYAARYLQLSFLDFIKDIVPYLFLAIIAILPGYYFSQWIPNIYLNMIFKIISVAIIYLSLLWLCGSQILKESFNFVLKRKKNGE